MLLTKKHFNLRPAQLNRVLSNLVYFYAKFLEPQPEDIVAEIGNVKPSNYNNLVQQKADLIKVDLKLMDRNYQKH